eukprot:2867814-Lingulodinium_polyedra.AAC.1
MDRPKQDKTRTDSPRQSQNNVPGPRWIRLDWIRLGRAGLDWSGMEWAGLDWTRLDATRLERIRDKTRLCYTRLHARLGQRIVM